MASSDSERIAEVAQTNARMAAQLMFISEVTQVLSEYDRDKMAADKKYADTIANLNGRIAIDVTVAMNRLRNSLETLKGETTEEDNDY